MFANFNLKSIENGDIRVNIESANHDLKLVIECFKEEGFNLSKWYLIEIAATESERVYCFKDSENHYVDMLIGANNQVTSNYFKNHDVDQYSLFQAESIREAIRLYEVIYSPSI
ncbi:hypothetical protein [Bacillus paramycoides]|uniref:hypothetical protein n=1 Tax=Bacillus paramycoides TaxID=2026194 RepID=UPI002E1E9CD8|nr:hypothetical protein [Bacillus paramycoides]